ncbi:hypothetical protein [Streptomyces lasiicapitis]|uniref:hypothetical protein n=1 Tax=Streptomyces lasiicapitis TaxID=1923961 RepID=UPI0036A6B559
MHDPAPDLASFAIALAAELPGNWSSEHQTHAQHPDQFARAEHVWDMDLLAHAVAENVLGQDAVLTRDDGTRLYVIARPRHGEEFLVGALAPADLHAEAFRAVREPDGIAVPDDPTRAAEDITHDLLPRYDKALAQVRGNAARLTAPQAAEPERVVMTWSGEAIVVDKSDRVDIVKALTDHGFAFDTDRGVFVLSGDDTAQQAASVRAAGSRLSELGIDTVLRHPQARPALGTTPVAQPSPPVTSPHRGR